MWLMICGVYSKRHKKGRRWVNRHLILRRLSHKLWHFKPLPTVKKPWVKIPTSVAPSYHVWRRNKLTWRCLTKTSTTYLHSTMETHLCVLAPSTIQRSNIQTLKKKWTNVLKMTQIREKRPKTIEHQQLTKTTKQIISKSVMNLTMISMITPKRDLWRLLATVLHQLSKKSRIMVVWSMIPWVIKKHSQVVQNATLRIIRSLNLGSHLLSLWLMKIFNKHLANHL